METQEKLEKLGLSHWIKRYLAIAKTDLIIS